MSDSSSDPALDKHIADEAIPLKKIKIPFEISPSWLILTAVLIGFGPVAALTVVASIKDVDALSTVALALAIIAFAIQILVFIVQTQSASQQMLQSERLNTQTRELLVEVKTSAASTQTLVGEQFRDLLRAFVQGASRTAAETGKFDPEQFEDLLLENIKSATHTPQPPEPRAAQSPLAERPKRTQKQKQASRRERSELTEFPDEAIGREIAEAMHEFPNKARRRLLELAEDEINSRETGVYVGLANEDEADDELVREGLITPARVRIENGVADVKRLTDKGRQWASLLVATGDIPDYAVGLTPTPEGEDDIPF